MVVRGTGAGTLRQLEELSSREKISNALDNLELLISMDQENQVEQEN
jgi:hypothetical protein